MNTDRLHELAIHVHCARHRLDQAAATVKQAQHELEQAETAIGPLLDRRGEARAAYDAAILALLEEAES